MVQVALIADWSSLIQIDSSVQKDMERQGQALRIAKEHRACACSSVRLHAYNRRVDQRQADSRDIGIELPREPARGLVRIVCGERPSIRQGRSLHGSIEEFGDGNERASPQSG